MLESSAASEFVPETRRFLGFPDRLSLTGDCRFDPARDIHVREEGPCPSVRESLVELYHHTRPLLKTMATATTVSESSIKPRPASGIDPDPDSGQLLPERTVQCICSAWYRNDLYRDHRASATHLAFRQARRARIESVKGDHLKTRQHYAAVDAELCDYSSGPMLAYGVVHASYECYRHTYHDYQLVCCDVDKNKFQTTDSTLFWNERVDVARILVATGAGIYEGAMVMDVVDYIRDLQFVIPSITFLFDDPHADFAILDQLSVRYKCGTLLKSAVTKQYLPSWKCSRDMIRAAYRMISKDPLPVVTDSLPSSSTAASSTSASEPSASLKPSLVTETSKYTKLWQYRFSKLEATDLTRHVSMMWHSNCCWAQHQRTNSSEKSTKQICLDRIEFDRNWATETHHVPILDIRRSLRSWFCLEDLRCLLLSGLLSGS